MDEKIYLYLDIKSRYYQDSLAALLATLPNVEFFIGEKKLLQPPEPISQSASHILLYERNGSSVDLSTLISGLRQAWPELKIILLVDSTRPVPNKRLPGVDLVLPVNTTAGELLQSINRLAGRTTAVRESHPVEPLVLFN